MARSRVVNFCVHLEYVECYPCDYKLPPNGCKLASLPDGRVGSGSSLLRVELGKNLYGYGCTVHKLIINTVESYDSYVVFRGLKLSRHKGGSWREGSHLDDVTLNFFLREKFAPCSLS